MSSNVYIARERSFIEIIDILQNNKYSNINICVRTIRISRQVLFDQ